MDPQLAPRVDAAAKVLGAARYAADLTRPGMLIGKVLRSPIAHGEIGSIDTSAALRLPGVRAVLTSNDLPTDVRVGRAIRDMPVLARGRVRFIGEKVAAVAADTAEIAEAAVDLIRVEYRELPAVYDPLDAIQPGAPLLHDPTDIRAWAAPRQVVPDHPNGVTQLIWGVTADEVERAFAAADHVVEHAFRVPPQHQVYLEPHTCLVEVTDDGSIDIWAANKAPFLLATYLEQGLGLPQDQLRIHPLPLGGDFGGKGSFMDIPLAYYLSRAAKRPIRMRMTFTEEITAANPRHAAVALVRSGIRRDGRVMGRLFRVYFASGAYAAFKPSPDAALPNIRVGATGPYDIPALRIEAEMVYTNTVPSGHMRNPGEAQTSYALECHTDLLARELGFDPAELRRINATHEPRRTASGDEIAPRIGELLESAAAAIRLDKPRPPGIGRGIALSEIGTSPGVYSAAMSIGPEGVVFRTPIIENGAGMLTAFREIVAQELEVPAACVSVEQSTARFTVDRGVGGSRVTRINGILVRQLAERIRQRLVEELGDGIGAEEAIGRLEATIDEQVTYQATAADNVTVHTVQAAEVAVDPVTGAVRPTHLVSVHEAGRVINRQGYQGQVEGALVQGLGYALMEGLVIDEGRVTNVNLHEYKVPTIADVPPHEVVVLPQDERLGITPIGEGAVGTAPAIANAIADALHSSAAFDLPITPQQVIDHATQASAAQRQPKQRS